ARAEAVARDLVDTGRAVTARAVREGASVRMAVAAEVARAWREASAEETEVAVPPVPDDVVGRLNAIWSDAYRAAVAAITPERNRLEHRVKALEEEVEKSVTDVTVLEEAMERAEVATEKANALAEQAEARAEASLKDVRTAESRAIDAEARANTEAARATAAEQERDRIAAKMDALIERIPAAGKSEA